MIHIINIIIINLTILIKIIQITNTMRGNNDSINPLKKIKVAVILIHRIKINIILNTKNKYLPIKIEVSISMENLIDNIIIRIINNIKIIITKGFRTIKSLFNSRNTKIDNSIDKLAIISKG